MPTAADLLAAVPCCRNCAAKLVYDFALNTWRCVSCGVRRAGDQVAWEIGT